MIKNRYEERIVAFVDILGFSRKVVNSIEDCEVIKILDDVLFEMAKLNPQDDELKVQTFSDCIVFSIGSNVAGGLHRLLLNLICLQVQLMYHQFIVRGGICKGKLKHDETKIFGPAMIKAVKLEKLAMYPRIIMSKEDFEESIRGTCLDTQPLPENREYCLKMLRECTELNDEYYFTDFIGNAVEVLDNPNDITDFSAKIKNLIDKNKNEKDIGISLKYKWLDSYHKSCMK